MLTYNKYIWSSFKPSKSLSSVELIEMFDDLISIYTKMFYEVKNWWDKWDKEDTAVIPQHILEKNKLILKISKLKFDYNNGVWYDNSPCENMTVTFNIENKT